MKYSISEVVEFIAENDVKFVRLVFCDVFGRIKNVTVMADCIEERHSRRPGSTDSGRKTCFCFPIWIRSTYCRGVRSRGA